jgi:hypothetical protein
MAKKNSLIFSPLKALMRALHDGAYRALADLDADDCHQRKTGFGTGNMRLLCNIDTVNFAVFAAWCTVRIGIPTWAFLGKASLAYQASMAKHRPPIIKKVEFGGKIKQTKRAVPEHP